MVPAGPQSIEGLVPAAQFVPVAPLLPLAEDPLLEPGIPELLLPPPLVLGFVALLPLRVLPLLLSPMVPPAD